MPGERILTYHNPNPIYSILTDAIRNKTRLPNESGFNPQTPSIPARSFFSFMSRNDTIAIYDPIDPAKTSGYQVVTEKPDAATFTDYGIEQSFYYDPAGDALISLVNKVTIKRAVYAENGAYRGRTPVTTMRYRPSPSSPEEKTRILLEAQ
jgi:hypothetical protein